jgi:hypothetical protein
MLQIRPRNRYIQFYSVLTIMYGFQKHASFGHCPSSNAQLKHNILEAGCATDFR